MKSKSSAKNSKSKTNANQTAKQTKNKATTNAVSKAQTTMEKFKMEAAKEVGINLKDGYNGNLTAKQAGEIGGRMIKKMVESYKKTLK